LVSAPVEPTWRRADGVLLCSAPGEDALLVRDSWSIVRLDRISRVIWDLLAEPRTTTRIVIELVSRYEVSPERCRAEILPLLDQLRGAGAVLGDGPSAP
jgi:hypothetical protein